MAKILVIEDEAPLREEIMEWLTYEGYEVLGAADGFEGVNTAVHCVPDLIICDIMMPHLDGYGVLLAVQANSTLQSTPFVFLSARADKDDIRRGMQLGADDYVTKPFDQQDLIKAIRARLEKKAALDLENQARFESFRQVLEMEHQQRLLQAKQVAMFAHDAQNQLMVINSSAVLLRTYADHLTEQRRLERLQAIEGSARLLIGLLNDMLTLAQMDTGQMKLKLEPVNVASFLQAIVQEFQTVPGETHHVQFDCTFVDTVLSDVRLLRQVAANLISNALKYSSPGSDIQVTLSQYERQYVLTVTDHGIGIPAADLHRLFDSFQRGSNVGNISGTGLGLAIVKQAVDMLGGWIGVESEVGTGTTIRVTLPCSIPVL